MDNYENPIPGKTYISQRLDAFGDAQRKVRIATKLIEHPQTYAFDEISADNRILECLAHAKLEYLVTGDRGMLSLGSL